MIFYFETYYNLFGFLDENLNDLLFSITYSKNKMSYKIREKLFTRWVDFLQELEDLNFSESDLNIVYEEYKKFQERLNNANI